MGLACGAGVLQDFLDSRFGSQYLLPRSRVLVLYCDRVNWESVSKMRLRILLRGIFSRAPINSYVINLYTFLQACCCGDSDENGDIPPVRLEAADDIDTLHPKISDIRRFKSSCVETLTCHWCSHRVCSKNI